MMASTPIEALYSVKTHPAMMISSASHPSSFDDLNLAHKDPKFELATGTRDAYLIKKLAGDLASKISDSEDVRNLSSLVNDSGRTLERDWRMASCISNMPTSTGYPYLPMMPIKGHASGESPNSIPSAATPASTAALTGVSVSNGVSAPQAADLKRSAMDIQLLRSSACMRLPIRDYTRLRSFIYL
jgi:hypothetical protein